MGVTPTQVAVATKDPQYLAVRIEARRECRALGFRELWDCRDLVYLLVWRDIKLRYKRTLIGAAWTILLPILTIIAFILFFGYRGDPAFDGINTT